MNAPKPKTRHRVLPMALFDPSGGMHDLMWKRLEAHGTPVGEESLRPVLDARLPKEIKH